MDDKGLDNPVPTRSFVLFQGPPHPVTPPRPTCSQTVTRPGKPDTRPHKPENFRAVGAVDSHRKTSQTTAGVDKNIPHGFCQIARRLAWRVAGCQVEHPLDFYLPKMVLILSKSFGFRSSLSAAASFSESPWCDAQESYPNLM